MENKKNFWHIMFIKHRDFFKAATGIIKILLLLRDGEEAL